MSEDHLSTTLTSKRPIYLPNELLIKILEGLIESYSLQICQDGHYPVKFVNLPSFLLNIKLANSLFYDELTRLLESRFDGRLRVYGCRPGRVLHPVVLAHNSWILLQIKELTLPWDHDITWPGILSLLDPQCTPKLQRLILAQGHGHPDYTGYVKTFLHGPGTAEEAESWEQGATDILSEPAGLKLVNRGITLWIDSLGHEDEETEEKLRLVVSVKRGEDGALVVRQQSREIWTREEVEEW